MQPGHQTYPCGEGTVEIDADGFVVGARHPAHPGLDALLTPRTAPWFGRESGWGTGFLLSSAGSGRFVRPESLEFSADGTTSAYTPVDGLRLTVERTFGDRWRERYRLRNRRDVPVTIGSFAIHTPIADTYGPAATVLRERLHAHVWTGGAESWLVGVRMDGTPPAFVLDLTEGELWAYSLGGRNQFTSSNIRGVVALHATDHARAPHAFGGQPILELAPGEELVLGWEIGWYDDVDAALSGHRATVTASTLAAPIGTPVVIGAGSGADTVVESGRHGVSHIDVMVGGGRRARVAV
ncbi:MAG TPA: hypothetical protein VI076_12805, partial [Actinopolymorphaceae bacterium]